MAKWSKAQQEAWAAREQAKAAEKTAEADAKRANATAAAAEAEARAATARAKARALEIEATEKASAAAHKRKMEESGRTIGERAWQIGSNVGTYAAGVGGGMLVARGLSKKQDLAVKASATHLDRLASDARKVISDARNRAPAPPVKPKAKAQTQIVKGKTPPKAKPPVTAPRLDAIAKAQLGNIARSAKDLKLMKLRAPMGAPLLIGAALIAEGIGSRFYMADKAKTDGEREAWNVIGNVSMAAGAAIPVKSYANGMAIAKSWTTSAASSHAMIKTAAELGTKVAAPARVGTMFRGAGMLGAIAGIGYAAAQTETGKKAIGDALAWVKGFTRTDSKTGKIEQVKPHYRTVRREKWRAG